MFYFECYEQLHSCDFESLSTQSNANVLDVLEIAHLVAHISLWSTHFYLTKLEQWKH